MRLLSEEYLGLLRTITAAAGSYVHLVRQPLVRLAQLPILRKQFASLSSLMLDLGPEDRSVRINSHR
jgi:hypothetical protein